jgi:hypothetical protein
MTDHSSVARTSARRRCRLALVLAATFLCGSGSPNAAHSDALQQAQPGAAKVASAVIGADGGAVALPGGAKVRVPKNALTSRVAISLREVALPASVTLPAGSVRVGKVYRVEPPIKTALPIAITLPYDPRLLSPGFDEGSISIYQLVSSTGQLSMVGSDTGDEYRESAGQDLDVENHVVTVLVRYPATYTLLALRY